MPFGFSLEEVLDHRCLREEARQREMAQAQRAVSRVENLLDEADGSRKRYAEELGALAQKGMTFAYQELYLNYIHGLTSLIERTRGYLEELRGVFEQRRALLREAARERQILEELRKEELHRYLIDERRAEAKVFDEMALRAFVMRDTEKNAPPLEELPS